MTHKMFFDRKEGEMYGVLTLQKDGKKLFERLPVASGQRGFLTKAQDWVNGKGATPYGKHWMTTRKVPLLMEPKGTPFYMIGTEKGGSTIFGPNGQSRTAIGLHLENKHPGSIGCTVLLHDRTEDECMAWALFAYLDRLSKYEPYIEFHVL